MQTYSFNRRRAQSDMAGKSCWKLTANVGRIDKQCKNQIAKCKIAMADENCGFAKGGETKLYYGTKENCE